jgi:hypothetical protein
MAMVADSKKSLTGHDKDGNALARQAEPTLRRAGTSLFFKLAAGLGVVTAFGFLFMRSLHDTTTTPYTAERQHLRSWTLVLEPASRPNDPLLAMRPAPELAGGLFQQVFSRTMESLSAPIAPAVPLVLLGEFDRVVRDRLTPDALLAAARAAKLETAAITPRCVVHRRVSEPGGSRQLFFVFFDAPSVSQFRQQLGLDPAALSPVLFIAGAGADFNSWLPQRVNSEAECLASIETADRSR